MSLTFTHYRRPDGKKAELEMTKIYPEDEAWLKANNVKISTEELPNGSFCIYADYGAKLEDDETPDEYIHIVGSDSCEGAMHIIVQNLKAIKGDSQ